MRCAAFVGSTIFEIPLSCSSHQLFIVVFFLAAWDARTGPRPRAPPGGVATRYSTGEAAAILPGTPGHTGGGDRHGRRQERTVRRTTRRLQPDAEALRRHQDEPQHEALLGFLKAAAILYYDYGSLFRWFSLVCLGQVTSFLNGSFIKVHNKIYTMWKCVFSVYL